MTNALQALGVAGGGLLAVTVMTMLAGGPADPALGETGFPDLVGVTDRCRGPCWQR